MTKNTHFKKKKSKKPLTKTRLNINDFDTIFQFFE